MTLEEIRALVQADLGFVDQVIRARLKSAVPLVDQVAEHIISGGGKRLRRGTRGKAAPEVNPDIHCPQCNAPMVKRQSQHGAFWGCSRYPNCKGTRKI